MNTLLWLPYDDCYPLMNSGGEEECQVILSLAPLTALSDQECSFHNSLVRSGKDIGMEIGPNPD